MAPTIKTAPKKLDPYNIRPRLMKQVSMLLGQLETSEHITVRERVQALVAISRIEQIFLMIRIKEPDEPDRSGTVVKKYAAAFANADGRRKPHPGSAEPKHEPDDSWFDDVESDDADDDSA
jgi:hypothetical protein